jgi:hypothetical protein
MIVIYHYGKVKEWGGNQIYIGRHSQHVGQPNWGQAVTRISVDIVDNL